MTTIPLPRRQASRARRGRRRLSLRLIVPLLLLASVLACIGAFIYGKQSGLDRLAEEAEALLQLQQSAIDNALAPYTYVAVEMTRRPDVISYFRASAEHNAFPDATNLVRRTAALSGSDEIFFADLQGRIFVTSETGDHLRPLGQNVRLRPSVQAAMQGRLGRFHDIDFENRKRIYTIAAPVRASGQIIGTVGLTLEFEKIERAWVLFPHIVFAEERGGMVLAANRESLRFNSLVPVRAGGDASSLPERTVGFSPVGSYGPHALVGFAADDSGTTYLRLTRYRPLLDWNLSVLTDVAPAYQQAWRYALMAGLAVLVLSAALLFLLERRMRLIERVEREHEIARTLEKKVAERTVALAEANERLVKTQKELVQAGKMAGLGQMMATLAHEFNQPVAAIRTYAENAGIFLGRGQGRKARDNLERIVALTERMANLSGHLKTFARKPGSQSRPIDLEKVCRAALDLAGPHMRSRKVDAVLREPATPVVVLAGAIRLEQVVVNLITNAADATGASGGEIVLSISRSEDAGVLTVADSGPGIPEDRLETVFDPFYTTKEVGQGLGLGLSIAYNIVRDFGGALRAANRPEGGAVFTLSLPLAEEGAEASSSRPAEIPTPEMVEG